MYHQTQCYFSTSHSSRTEDLGLADWWMQVRLCFRKCYRTNFDRACLLICWQIWKERNARVFDQQSRSPDQLVEAIKEEIVVWKEAGYFTVYNS